MRISPPRRHGRCDVRRRFGLSSSDLVPRLRVFELPAERRAEAVAEAQELDGVKGSLGRALFHLHPAGAALRGAELDVGILEPAQEPAPRAERGAEVVAAEAE